MQHFEKGIRHQDDQHISVACKLLTRDERHTMGSQLVAIYRQLVKLKSNHRSHGFAAVNRGGLTRQMWVVKKPIGNLRKGQKVLRRAQMEHYAELGATFREIRFPADKTLMKALKSMARVIQPLHHPAQYGFVPKRDCVQSAQIHAYARTVFLLDIENAFNQIKQNEVEQILRKVFLINKDEAHFIAELCCFGGRLYQGNPMAPALFNIRALNAVDRLSKLMKANGGEVTVYADDITISHPFWEYFSKGFQKTVYRIIRECGLKVNPSKCHVKAVSPRKIGHFDITGLVIDYDEATNLPFVRPTHKRRTLKKSKYLARTLSKGGQFTNELAKDGTNKDIECVILGLDNWAKRRGEPEPKLQLAL